MCFRRLRNFLSLLDEVLPLGDQPMGGWRFVGIHIAELGQGHDGSQSTNGVVVVVGEAIVVVGDRSQELRTRSLPGR